MVDNNENQTSDNSNEIDLGESVLNNLEDIIIFLNPEYPDVNLIVEDKMCPELESILPARSNYFRALFFETMKEKNMTEIELKNSKLESFKILLQDVYTMQMNLGRTAIENILYDILELAHQWEFEELESSVVQFMIANIALPNVCARLNAGVAYRLQELIGKCIEFVENHPDTILDHPTFRTLSPEAIFEVISRDTFCAPEEKIFKTVRDWLCHYDTGTLPYGEMNLVCRAIRLPLLDEITLIETVLPAQLLPQDIIFDEIFSRTDNRDLNSLRRHRPVDIPGEVRNLSGIWSPPKVPFKQLAFPIRDFIRNPSPRLSVPRLPCLCWPNFNLYREIEWERSSAAIEEHEVNFGITCQNKNSNQLLAEEGNQEI